MFKLLIFITLLCGLSVSALPPSTRVVGGEDAIESQFPYQISLRYTGRHICGGSILSRTVILTASHCVDGMSESEFSIRAGSTDLYTGGVVVNVAKILMHEEYGNFFADVALLFLEKKLIYSKSIQPIQLATQEVPAGAAITVSGWGRVKHLGDIPRFLQHLNLNCMATSECSEYIGYLTTESFVCLEHSTGSGVCNGDSGGPAVWNNQLVGVANFIIGECALGYPDAYASVYYHLDWIKKNAEL